MGEPGRFSVWAGWVLVVLSGLCLVGSWDLPHTRCFTIEALLTRPTLATLVGSLLLICVANLSVVPALFGLYAAIRGHRHGKILIVVSGLLLLVTAYREFQPSDRVRSCAGGRSFLASHPLCECSVVFPHETKSREAVVAGHRSHLVESAAASVPHFRAEFAPRPEALGKLVTLENTLKMCSRVAGIATPEITGPVSRNSTRRKPLRLSNCRTAGPA